MLKNELKKYFLKCRDEVSDKETKSINISNSIIESTEFKNSNIIAVYSSFNNEVNIDKVIN